MAGRPSAAQDAAKKEWKKAPADNKPSARELAAKHGLSESTVHRAPWWKSNNRERNKMSDTTQPGADAIDLLPCPFCGSERVALIHDTSSDHRYDWDFAVECECGAKGESDKSDEHAATVWNRRAAQPVEAATWTKERITELAKDIAVSVAKNASTVPQLTFPHIYLGLCEALLAATHPAEPVVKSESQDE